MVLYLPYIFSNFNKNKQMKNLLFTLALIVTFSCANDNKENVNKENVLKYKIDLDLKKFSNLSNNKEYDKVMDLMNPNLFEIATREEMIKVYEGLGSMGMDMVLGTPVITKISEIFNLDGYDYIKVNYTSDLTMIISGELLAGIDAMIESINSEMSSSSASIEFLESTNTFYIKELQQSMIGMVRANGNDWKYVEFKNMDLLKEILPLEVIEKFE